MLVNWCTELLSRHIEEGWARPLPPAKRGQASEPIPRGTQPGGRHPLPRTQSGPPAQPKRPDQSQWEGHWDRLQHARDPTEEKRLRKWMDGWMDGWMEVTIRSPTSSQASEIFDSELKDQEREVCFVDIAYDDIPDRYYKESEDLRYFKSEKTSRGMLQEGWRDTQHPIMCSYKLVTVKFEVWGLQTRVEQFVHKVIRDVLLLGHRQAFAWVDEWIDMTMDEVREFERTIQEATNEKIGMFPPSISISETPLSSCTLTGPASAPSTPLCTDAPDSLSVSKDRPRKKSAPETLTLPVLSLSGVQQGSSTNPLPSLTHLQSSTSPSSSSDPAAMEEQ
ncbi:cytoplasmic phosphatidylinositol transfer protein 1-like isoform X1 [Phyllopteryx taeniolatus]|uniref:cytoplasmic phosphatidylinositol transfer protein 1-like isoform X1 n=1 Tax=Phyllopteryx taeniolatus TaxID=161469 RepID=UPI002AD305A2|nr:cytoplasmic phosphatidylinositol transfer protein 1-like isoform X1 [Phyllopteryx taeniolatus]